MIYIAMEGVKNLTTAMWKKEAYTPKILNWLLSTDKLDKKSMWVCATSLGSLYANLNFNIPVPVGLARENPARIRE